MAQLQGAQPGGGAAGGGMGGYPWMQNPGLGSMQGPAVDVAAMYGGMGAPGQGHSGGNQITPVSNQRAMAPPGSQPGMPGRPPVPGAAPGGGAGMLRPPVGGPAPGRAAMMGGMPGASMGGMAGMGDMSGRMGGMAGMSPPGGDNQLGLLDILSQLQQQRGGGAGTGGQGIAQRGRMPAPGSAAPVRSRY